jgi:hypothetical protein
MLFGTHLNPNYLISVHAPSSGLHKSGVSEKKFHFQNYLLNTDMGTPFEIIL